MKIVSYNIRFGLGTDHRIDLKRIAETVCDADIIGLQEVERFWKRGGMLDQPDIIGGHLKDRYWVYCPAFDMDASERQDNGSIIPTFPRCPSNSWKSYHRSTTKGTASLPQPSDGLILEIGPRPEGHYPDFPPFRQTPPVVFTWPSIFPAYTGTGLRRRSSIRLRIFRNSSLGTATSANWNVT